MSTPRKFSKRPAVIARRIYWFAMPVNERPRCTDNDSARWNYDQQPVMVEARYSNGTARVRPNGSDKTFTVEQSELYKTRAAAATIRTEQEDQT